MAQLQGDPFGRGLSFFDMGYLAYLGVSRSRRRRRTRGCEADASEIPCLEEGTGMPLPQGTRVAMTTTSAGEAAASRI